jgi:hypothetical protein
MTTDERSALLLAARLLEAGVPLESPTMTVNGGQVKVGITLAERLQRVVDGPERASEIIASLRAAATDAVEAPAA